MFCMKCGREISNDARFCDRCGTPVQIVVPQSAQRTASTPARKSAPSRRRHGGKKGLLLVAAIVLVAVVAVGVFALMPAKEQTLEEIYTLKGVRSASIDFYKEADGDLEDNIHMETDVEDEIDDLWSDLEDIPLRKVKGFQARKLKEGLMNGPFFKLYIWADQGCWLLVNEDGVVWDGDKTYYQGGEDLYEALEDYLPSGHQLEFIKVLPAVAYESMDISLKNYDGTSKSAYIDDWYSVQEFAGFLEYTPVPFAGRTYEDSLRTSLHDKITLTLRNIEGQEFVIKIEADGYGEIQVNNWTYGFFSQNLFDRLNGMLP